MDYTELLEQFKLERKQKYAEKTIKTYCRLFIKFMDFHKKSFINVTEDDILDWLDYLLFQGRENNDRALKLNALKAIFAFCLTKHYIISDPSRKLYIRNKRKKLPTVLTKDEFFRIQEAANKSLRDRAMVDVLYDTGVRPFELVKIKIGDIDFADLSIKILGKGNKERYVFFKPECGEIIKTYLSTRIGDSPFLFITHHGKPFIKETNPLWYIMARLRLAASLNKPLSAKIFRSTMATELLENGCPIEIVAELLGHEDIQTTEYYAEISPNIIKELPQKHF